MVVAASVLFVHWGEQRFRGSESVLLELARGLRDRGTAIGLWSNHQELHQRAIRLGLCSRLEPVHGLGAGLSLAGLRAIASEAVALAGFARQLDASIVVANNAAPIPLVLATRRQVEVVTHAHLHTRYLAGDVIRHGLPGLDGITGVSEHCVSTLRGTVRDSIIRGVVPNGTAIPLVPMPAPRRSSTLRAVIIGALVPNKNVGAAIEAVMAAHRDGAEIALEIVGDGPERDRLQARCANHPAISFAGWREDVSAILSGSDVLLSCALEEPFGLTLIEAAAHGIASIAVNAAGPAEIVREGVTGYLVSPHAIVAELASRLSELARQPAVLQRLGRNARTLAEASFSNARMVDCFQDSVLADRRPTQASLTRVGARLAGTTCKLIGRKAFGRRKSGSTHQDRP